MIDTKSELLSCVTDNLAYRIDDKKSTSKP